MAQPNKNIHHNHQFYCLKENKKKNILNLKFKMLIILQVYCFIKQTNKQTNIFCYKNHQLSAFCLFDLAGFYNEKA